MHVIGIGGMAGSGKTTAADFIEIESINLDCKPIRISFADPVRAEAAKRAGYDDWRLLKKEKHEEYRKLCQEIADEGRPSTWVNIMNEKLQKIQAEETQCSSPIFEERLVIIDDVRFHNELELIKAYEGTTVFIHLGDRMSDLPDGPWRTHESEELSQLVEAQRPEYTDLFQWDIFNDKDHLVLEKKLADRLDAFCGTAPVRFAKPCDCPTCRLFRADIQVSEMIDGFQEAIDRAVDDPDLPDETKDEIRESFEDIIEKLQSGEISPLDLVFDEFEEEDNDEETDNGHS